MSQKDNFIEIKDVDSIKRALENAEIDYEEFDDEAGEITIELEQGIKFYFNSESGEMTNLKP